MAAGVLIGVCLSLICITQAREVNIYQLHIVSDIAYRFATTNVTSYLANTANTAKEAEFKLTIPDAAFINKFFMEIDGEIYEGSVKEKAEAQQQYEAAKDRGQSAGQIRRRANTKANVFEVQVNIAAESKVRFSLTYQELLQRKLGIYKHVINLDPGQVVKDLQVEVNIRESRKIVTLEVPMLKQKNQNSVTNQVNRHAVIERLSDTEARITYAPDSHAQKEAALDEEANQFVVKYDLERTLSGGEVLVVDGYFVHFFAPSGLPPVPKDIVFILDVSGSMSGNKLEQLKVAMSEILGKLRAGDRFNIITFATKSEVWDIEGLLSANSVNIARAKDFVGNLITRGSTNINEALLDGISFMKTHKTVTDTTKRPAIVVFLTDGMPNESESDPAKIAMNLVQANEGYASVFSLGFGNDVDFTFLKKLSLQNDGFARKIYVDADPALQLENFYEEISTPLLTDVNITYLGNTVEKKTITPTCFLNFFKGTEIIVAGKLNAESMGHVVSQVSADSASGYVEFVAEANVTSEPQNFTTVFDVNHFTERLWAYFTIKKMLDKTLQTTDTNVTAEANEKALDLALKYQFVTPLTSMVVTKPNETEEIIEPVVEPEVAEDSYLLSALPGPPGIGGGGYSMYNVGVQYIQQSRGSMRGPKRKILPHKPARMPRPTTSTALPTQTATVSSLPKPTCVTVSGGNGDIFQLFADQHQDIIVNGKVRIPRILPAGHNYNDHTYFARLGILHSGIRLLIKPKKIDFDGLEFSWSAANGQMKQDISLELTPQNDLIIKIDTVLVIKLTNHRHYLEIVNVTSGLDRRCSSVDSYLTSGSVINNSSEVNVPHLTSPPTSLDCLQAYTRQTNSRPTDCHVIQYNQWQNVAGQSMRYNVAQLYQKKFAFEYR